MDQTPDHRRTRGTVRRENTVGSVGVIGLGAMGSRIATRFLTTSHRVYATNRTAAKAQPLIEHGLRGLGTPREVAGSADVDMSPVSPQAGRRLAERVRAHRVDMLDAPVSGSIPQVEKRDARDHGRRGPAGIRGRGAAAA